MLALWLFLLNFIQTFFEQYAFNTVSYPLTTQSLPSLSSDCIVIVCIAAFQVDDRQGYNTTAQFSLFGNSKSPTELPNGK